MGFESHAILGTKRDDAETLKDCRSGPRELRDIVTNLSTIFVLEESSPSNSMERRNFLKRRRGTASCASGILYFGSGQAFVWAIV